MKLEAYLDESGPKDGSFVLAGYLATAEQWKIFTEEWKNHLTGPPYWPSFKMSQIVYSQSPEAMERAEWMYRIVERNVEAAVCCAIDTNALSELIPFYGLSEKLTNPYFFVFETIVDRLAKMLVAVRNKDGTPKFDGPIKFVFDERSEEKKIVSSWDALKRYLNSNYIEGLPIFANDREVAPLQAADMMAYWMKRYWDRFYKLKDIHTSNPFPWETKRAIPTFTFEYGKERLIGNLRRLHNRDLGDLFCPTSSFQYSYSHNGQVIFSREPTPDRRFF